MVLVLLDHLGMGVTTGPDPPVPVPVPTEPEGMLPVAMGWPEKTEPVPTGIEE